MTKPTYEQFLSEIIFVSIKTKLSGREKIELYERLIKFLDKNKGA